jgi:integrase
MNPIDVAKEYLKNRAVSRTHEARVLVIAGRLKEFSRDCVNEYIRRRLQNRSAISVRTERSIILSVWRWGWESDLVEHPPKGVARFRTRKEPTRAWTVPQVEGIIAAARKAGGKRRMWSGAPAALFLETWLRLGYESGARLGDNFAFTKDNLDGDVLRWTQAKTGDAIHKVLSPECLACVHAMLDLSPDGSIIGWACSKRQASRRIRELLAGCGFGGTSKWLRRSGATHIEMAQPGKASLHLGHRTAALAAQAYLDWGQIRSTTPMVPRLAGG